MSAIFDLDLPPNCPVSHATEQQLLAYRVVVTDPPTAYDLRTYQELDLLPNANACKRASLSIYASYQHARHRLNVSPHLGSHVASAQLTAAHGLITSPSPIGHIDWWPYAGKRDPAEFQVVTS